MSEAKNNIISSLQAQTVRLKSRIDELENERMHRDFCSIHNVPLKCMGGRSAHPSNWYCPKCDEDEANLRVIGCSRCGKSIRTTFPETPGALIICPDCVNCGG